MSLLDFVQPVTITAAEEANLVALVRRTQSAKTVDLETGEEVTKFFPTREQEDALQTLIAAYVLNIKQIVNDNDAARKIIGSDEAEAVAVEKFIQIVRNESRTNERLAGFVGKAMANAVRDAVSEAASVIRIPAETLRLYFALVDKHGSAEAAYVACKTEANNMSPHRFLAVNRSLNSDSLDRVQVTNDGEDYESEPGAEATLLTAVGHEPSAEDKVVADDLVRWMFTKVGAVEGDILRLAYGFVDPRTEALRIQHGYQWDQLLSDAQIAPVVSMGRQTVNRVRNKALATLRSELNALMAE